jgi:hypothetical protein
MDISALPSQIDVEISRLQQARTALQPKKRWTATKKGMSEA